MKKILFQIVLLVVLIVLAMITYRFIKRPGPYDATYIINGQSVTLKNGEAVTDEAPGSASKLVTRAFGNEISHDFDGDGREDKAFIITQNGSGIFYYVVARLNKFGERIGSHGLLLGDRIAPQNIILASSINGTSTSINPNIIIVNYADRNPGEPMSTPPSVGKSLYLLLDTKTMQFGEVVPNFEGEADISKMSLEMKKWEWVRTTYDDGKNIAPKIPGKFALTFNKDNKVSVNTDCNGVGGSFIVDGSKISFSQMVSTLMYCEGSQEQEFDAALGRVQNYSFTSKGELVLSLIDGGSMVFK